MEVALLVKISSQISPNSTRFGVNMELSAKDTRFGNNLAAVQEDTSKETVYLRLKLVLEFIYHAGRKKKVDSL